MASAEFILAQIVGHAPDFQVQTRDRSWGAGCGLPLPDDVRIEIQFMAMTVAQEPYEPEGYVLDFVTVPSDGTPTTLQSGETYYIQTSYYSGSSVIVQSGCTVKFKNGAYMLLYGPVSFPSSTPYAVFTSRNDDLYGQRICGVQNEMDSDGDPTSHLASKAIWIYYVNFSTTIRYTQIRWATQGVRYDTNPGGGVTHYFQNSLPQNCPSGGKIVAAWMDPNKGHNSLGEGYPTCYAYCIRTWSFSVNATF